MVAVVSRKPVGSLSDQQLTGRSQAMQADPVWAALDILSGVSGAFAAKAIRASSQIPPSGPK
jgi:hypothetical protein